MIILSLHTAFHDSGAALFDEYSLLAAVQQERLTRRKGDGGVPLAAMDEVLAIAGIDHRRIDALVLTRAQYPQRFIRGHEPLEDLVAAMIAEGTDDAHAVFDADAFRSHLGLAPDVPVFFTNHHLAHALPALFHTDWQDGLIYTADGCGDNVHYSHRVFKDGRLTSLFGDDRWLHGKRRVDSLGLAYGHVTEALGFRANRHEGKLTGLAGFGQPSLAGEIGRHFTVDDNGVIDSDFPTDEAMRGGLATLAQSASPADMAASIQVVVEQVLSTSIGRLLERHGLKHLGLAGGVFSNVRLNRLLCETSGVEEIFVFPGMGDEGLVVGGALDFLLSRDGLDHWLRQRRRLTDVFWGRDHGAEIDRVLGDCPAVEVLAGAPAETAADLLAAGQAGAVFHGRMEFGPRALGNRSILASPADADINQRLNARLNRSEFMPFAPYVLAEDADLVFAVNGANRYACRFMTITTAVRPEWRDRIPAVVHVDGTARPQIVDPAAQPLYAGILAQFKRRTGLPVLVNTSLNAHEEPIINRPEECLAALLAARIDFVVTDQAVYRQR